MSGFEFERHLFLKKIGQTGVCIVLASAIRNPSMFLQESMFINCIESKRIIVYGNLIRRSIKMAAESLEFYLKEYEKDGIEVLSDESAAFCTLCTKRVNCFKKEKNKKGEILLRPDKAKVRSHVIGKKHRKKMAIKEPKQMSIEAVSTSAQVIPRQKKFNLELSGALLKSGAPLNIVEHEEFRKFLRRWTDMTVPHRSTLGKSYVKPHYQDTMEQIREKMKDCNGHFQIGETTDSKGRCVIAIIVTPMNGSPAKPMLARVKHFQNYDYSVIQKEFQACCVDIWGDNGFEKLIIVVTDQAKCMLKAFRTLKQYSSLYHITCLCHALNLVAEEVRKRNPKANKFISSMKIVLKCSPDNFRKYKEVTQLPLPPEPIITRWGTWLNAANFYNLHYEKISLFVERLKDGPESVSQVKNLIQDPQLRQELRVAAHYLFISESIKKLESHGLTIDEQIRIINCVENKLGSSMKDRLRQVLKNNPSYEWISDPTPSQLEGSTRDLIKFAPLVSVDAERCFSLMNNLLSKRRLSFKPETISQSLIIQFNHALDEEEDDKSMEDDHSTEEEETLVDLDSDDDDTEEEMDI